jgi:hypothetical protein
MPLPTKYLSLAELTKRPEWRALTAKQRLFTSKWISSGDALASCAASYPGTKNPKVYVHALLASERIKAVVNLMLGKSESEKILDDLKVLVKRAKRKGSLTHLAVLAIPMCRAAAALEEFNLAQKSKGN